MDNHNDDPAWQLVRIYDSFVANRPPVTSYIGKVTLISATYIICVAVIVSYGTRPGITIALLCALTALLTIAVPYAYVIAHNKSVSQRLNAALVNEDITSVSLRRWPICFAELVRARIVLPHPEYTVTLHIHSQQPRKIARFLSRALPDEEKTIGLNPPPSPEMIKRIKKQIYGEAVILKRKFRVFYTI